LGTYSAVASSLTTVVQNVSVVSPSSTVSSSSKDRFNIGTFYCGDTAGSANVKLKFTTTGTGEIVESPAIAARCADSAYTFTASTDKAAYTQGEIATVTVQFLDSKGNKANSVVAVKVYGEDAHRAAIAGDSTASPVPVVVNLSFTLAEPAVSPQ